MQTIGERLEEARKRKNIGVKEAAEATKIRGDYLQKFEKNQFDIGLSEIYVRGFLRTYAHFLKLPAERLVSDYRLLGSAPVLEGKPRQVSREVYGRMDLSITSASGKNKNAEIEANPEGLDDGAENSPNPRKFARIGTSLPDGPFIDQRILWRVAAVAGLLVLVLLILWGVRSLSGTATRTESGLTSSAPLEASIRFTAMDTVRIKVSLKRGPEDRTGEEIFQGTLVRGESREMPKRGSLYLTASALELIEFESGGRKIALGSLGYKGYDRIEIK